MGAQGSKKAGWKVLVTFAVAAAAGLLAFLLNLTAFFEDFELSTMRARVQVRGKCYEGAENAGAKVPGIAIIDVDERSLLPPDQEGLGRYPDWTREYYAQVVDLVAQAEPAALVFDIHFFEPAGNPDYPRINRRFLEGARSVDEVAGWMASHSEDEVFAGSVARAGDVILGLSAVDFSAEEQARDVSGNPFTARAIKLPPEVTRNLYYFTGWLPPIPELSGAARMLGHTKMSPYDEIIWRVPLLISAEGPRPGEVLVFPSLSLAAVAQALGVPLDKISFDPDVGVLLGDSKVIPTTPQAELLLNYLGPPGQGPEGTFNYYSFTDIEYLAVRDDMSPEQKAVQAWDNFHGKVVLVGGTAEGLFDFISSPFSNTHPGLEIHATAIANMLGDDYLDRLDPGLALGIFILLTLGVGFLVAYLRWWVAIPLTLVLLGGYIFGAFWIFSAHNLWLEIVRPGSGILLALVTVVGFNYVTEQRAKRKIKDTFQHYVSPAVVEQMIDNPDLLRLGGEKLDLSVIFTDVKGFTRISEQMEPTDLVHLMNDYLTPMADIILANRGTVDKFIGDAVMGIFGAPVPVEHHADAACHTALEMIAKLEELNAQWKPLNLPHMSMRIGINSGPMVVGNMGSHTRFDYTVMGDNVNLGARLEPLNKIFSTQVICSEFTRERLVDRFILRSLGSFRVMGKTEPVICYELLGLGTPEPELESLLAEFKRGLSLWEGREFKAAFDAFERLGKGYPQDGPTAYYASLCREMAAFDPGDDWRPIHTLLFK
ncbi:MAG: adenylate/guanylate cyclase domain-containing protein [bacterium]|nr:adenylate/guanylate cyclase domain-containing protein [bacterium]